MYTPVQGRSGVVAQMRRFPVLYGLAWALFWAVVGTIAVGIWANYDNLHPTAVIVSVYVVHGVAIVTGGITASRHAGTRGWFYGGITGLVYSLLMVVIGFIVYNTFVLDAPGILRICILTLVGAFSGVIGVNMRYKP